MAIQTSTVDSASLPAGAASTGIPASLPLRRDKPDAGPDATSLAMVAMLLVILLTVAIAVGWRRRTRGEGASGALRSFLRGGKAVALSRLSSQPLTAQASLHVVNWHGEELLLGCTPGSVSLLARRPVPEHASPQEMAEGTP